MENERRTNTCHVAGCNGVHYIDDDMSIVRCSGKCGWTKKTERESDGTLKTQKQTKEDIW
jgi:hypothetical protein